MGMLESQRDGSDVFWTGRGEGNGAGGKFFGLSHTSLGDSAVASSLSKEVNASAVLPIE